MHIENYYHQPTLVYNYGPQPTYNIINITIINNDNVKHVKYYEINESIILRLLEKMIKQNNPNFLAEIRNLLIETDLLESSLTKMIISKILKKIKNRKDKSIVVDIKTSSNDKLSTFFYKYDRQIYYGYIFGICIFIGFFIFAIIYYSVFNDKQKDIIKDYLVTYQSAICDKGPDGDFVKLDDGSILMKNFSTTKQFIDVSYPTDCYVFNDYYIIYKTPITVDVWKTKKQAKEYIKDKYPIPSGIILMRDIGISVFVIFMVIVLIFCIIFRKHC